MEISIDSPGAWITYEPHGRQLGRVVGLLPSWISDCATPPGQTTSASQACFDRLAAEGYRQHVEYQPASRFWPLQLIETGLLLALAAAAERLLLLADPARPHLTDPNAPRCDRPHAASL